MHPPIQAAVRAALEKIFIEGRHAEKVVDFNLKNQKKWGARDRRQFAEAVYEIVRWWRTLLVASGRQWNEPVEGATATFTIEDCVAVFEEYKRGMTEKAAFSSPAVATLAKSEATRADRESLPNWLDRLGEKEIGAAWPKILSALNKQAPQFLRVNTLKIKSPEKLAAELSAEDIFVESVPGVPTALRLTERKNVFQTRAFKAGGFEMQDAGSQKIAPLLQVQPGERVIDACAGAGGKTLHLAALMANKGKILSLDVHAWKLNELKTRAARAGASIIETREIDSTKVIKRLHESADAVLLDVPCSGLGVLRRHPDTKWKFSLKELAELEKLQSEILDRYALMAKPGGRVVYATCSILPSENEGRVQSFLERAKGAFVLEEEIKVSPFETAFDGFYAARLKRLN